MKMMDQFRVEFWPGGMSLNRSAFWLVEDRFLADGRLDSVKHRLLKYQGGGQ